MTTQETSKKPTRLFVAFVINVLMFVVFVMCLIGSFVAGAIYTASTESTQIGEDKCRQITATQDRYIGWKLILDPGWKAYICKE